VRVERLEREFAVDVEWWPFELHPEIPTVGIERRRPAGQRSARHEYLRSLAEAAGLVFEPPARVVNSHKALEAAEFTREQGAFAQYHRALFEAYFGQGRDMADVEVLSELAADVGLDPDALREALASRRYASMVDERTEEARRWGITGTPTFIFENGDRRLPIVGAQEYAVFESVAQRFGAARRSKNQEPEAGNQASG